MVLNIRFTRSRVSAMCAWSNHSSVICRLLFFIFFVVPATLLRCKQIKQDTVYVSCASLFNLLIADFGSRFHWTHAIAYAVGRHAHAFTTTEAFSFLSPVFFSNSFRMQLACVASFDNWHCAPLMWDAFHQRAHTCIETADWNGIMLKLNFRIFRSHEPQVESIWWSWSWKMCSISWKRHKSPHA